MGKPVQRLFFMLWAVVLTAGAITLILAALPMHISWRLLNRPIYYCFYMGFSALAVALGFTELGIALFFLSFTVGVHNEALVRGREYFTSAIFALGALLIPLYSGVCLWVVSSGFPLIERSQKYIETLLAQYSFSQEVLSSDVVVTQFPSMVVLFLGVALFVSLLFEKKVYFWMGLKGPERKPLDSFGVPGFMIWFLMASLLGTFLFQGDSFVQKVSINILNISAFAYFFQGLAVISRCFDAFRFSSLSKILLMVILVLHLSFLLSLIGVIDYWVNIRERLAKGVIQIKEGRR